MPLCSFIAFFYYYDLLFFLIFVPLLPSEIVWEPKAEVKKNEEFGVDEVRAWHWGKEYFTCLTLCRHSRTLLKSLDEAYYQSR